MSASRDSLSRDSELRELLLDRKIEEFNEKAGEAPPQLEDVAMRGLDLTGFDLSHANLRGAYLRSADLRGLDLYWADMEGASIHGARISGVRFPPGLSAAEIKMSLEHGTRMRMDRPAQPSPPVEDTAASDGGDPAPEPPAASDADD